MASDLGLPIQTGIWASGSCGWLALILAATASPALDAVLAMSVGIRWIMNFDILDLALISFEMMAREIMAFEIWFLNLRAHSASLLIGVLRMMVCWLMALASIKRN